jgi:hypothetical protein
VRDHVGIRGVVVLFFWSKWTFLFKERAIGEEKGKKKKNMRRMNDGGTGT